MPARMVGCDFSSGKRKPGKDAGNVLKRAVGRGHGRLLPALFLMAVVQAVGWTEASAGQLDGGRTMPTRTAMIAGRIKAPIAKQAVRAENPPTPEELTAARGIEAMFVDMLIQEMRKSIPENEVMPRSNSEKIFQQMLDSEHARMMSESGMFGVADLVLAQMRGKR